MANTSVAETGVRPGPLEGDVSGKVRMSRAGALTGVAGAALYVIGALLPGAPPKPDAPVSQVISFFTGPARRIARWNRS